MNFGDMTTYVAKRLIDPNNTAVDTSDIQQAINDSIAYWKFRRFWFNEVDDTAVCTAQSPLFPIPTDFLVNAFDDDGFCIEYGGVRYPLAKSTAQIYDALFLQYGYGLPRWYARDGNGNYICYPIPDQAYTVRRHYLKDYVALVNNTDANDFTNNASRLITLWALGNLINELRQDTSMGGYYQAQTQNEYRNLRVLTDKDNGQGKLTIFSQLNDRGFR